VINTLWQIVASKRFESDNPTTKRIMMLLNSQAVGRYSKTMFFPTLFKILPMREVDCKLQQLKSYLKGLINEHKQDIDYDNPRDFMDVYLTQMNNEDSSRFHKVEPKCY
jgi:hypothetical protein